MTVTLSGAGKLALAGKVTDLNLNIGGAGNLDAAHLQAQQATVDSSGVGRAVVNASERLSVTISGVGDVEYLGSPHIQKKISGLGRVTQRK